MFPVAVVAVVMAASHDRPPSHHPDSDDAFGRMLADYQADAVTARPVYRRDDGERTEAHPAVYFEEPAEWPDRELSALEAWVEGDVLDVGCGAGRTALWAGKRGHGVTAVDRSPGAVAVAADRGVDRVFVVDQRDLAVAAGDFGTVVVLGTHLGLGDSLADLRRTLAALARVTVPGGRLVASLNDPTRTGPAYRESHRVAPGAAYRRFRVEYDGLVGPWVEILTIEFAALRDLLEESAWTVADASGVDDDGPGYLVVLERDG